MKVVMIKCSTLKIYALINARDDDDANGDDGNIFGHFLLMREIHLCNESMYTSLDSLLQFDAYNHSSEQHHKPNRILLFFFYLISYK